MGQIGSITIEVIKYIKRNYKSVFFLTSFAMVSECLHLSTLFENNVQTMRTGRYDEYVISTWKRTSK